MNDSNQNESEALEVMPPSASLAIETASINSQITTAKAYPRSLQVFKKRAIDMATLDEETAESCLYRRPVGGGKFAEGMSVRMSEIVGASYGNLRVRATIVEQTERFVRARGEAIDLESNFASSSECIESTVKKDGTPYDERMRVVIAKSALSKARRDAMFQVVPRALAKPVENAVRSLLMGDTKTLENRRQMVVQWMGKLGIGSERVYAALGVKGEADLGAEQLETLTGIRTALKDNEITLDEAFPPLADAVKRSEPPPRSSKGAKAAKENADQVPGDPKPAATQQPNPAQPEPPKPAEQAPPPAEPVPATTVVEQNQPPRALLKPDEELITTCTVVSATGVNMKQGNDLVPSAEVKLSGGFEGIALHIGGADPAPNEEVKVKPIWVVGSKVKVTLFGKQTKAGVKPRVTAVEAAGAVVRNEEE